MQYESPSVEALMERVVHLATRGYSRFFTGTIPEHASVHGVDAKLTGKYGLRKLSKASRARRKGRGLANLYYFRHERFFIVMATAGILDPRPGGVDPWKELSESSLVYGPYEVSLSLDGFRRSVRVRLREEVFANERAYLLDMALRRNRAYLETVIFNLPYNCWAPIRTQLRGILDDMNAKRKRSGFELLTPGCIRFLRTRPKHFEEVAPASQCAA